jgi:hypothetical protein
VGRGDSNPALARDRARPLVVAPSSESIHGTRSTDQMTEVFRAAGLAHPLNFVVRSPWTSFVLQSPALVSRPTSSRAHSSRVTRELFPRPARAARYAVPKLPQNKKAFRALTRKAFDTRGSTVLERDSSHCGPEPGSLRVAVILAVFLQSFHRSFLRHRRHSKGAQYTALLRGVNGKVARRTDDHFAIHPSARPTRRMTVPQIP